MSQHTQLQASDGHKFDAYIAQPSGEPKAGIVVLQEIFGVTAHIQSVADRFARAGYRPLRQLCSTALSATSSWPTDLRKQSRAGSSGPTAQPRECSARSVKAAVATNSAAAVTRSRRRS